MAKIRIDYTVTLTQFIDWPDDEMEDFTYENALNNLEVHKARDADDYEIVGVEKDGEEFYF